MNQVLLRLPVHAIQLKLHRDILIRLQSYVNDIEYGRSFMKPVFYVLHAISGLGGVQYHAKLLAAGLQMP